MMKVWVGASPGQILILWIVWIERSSSGETNKMKLEANKSEFDDEKGQARAIAGSLNLPFETIAPESVTPLIYQQIFETMREGLWMIDACGVTTYVNDQMAGILGYSVNEMIGRPFFEFMDSSSHADAVVLFDRRCEGIRFC
jgi:PAS domain-containing protein